MIGLIDWGIGGLSVYKELKKEIKNFSCVYLSDSGFTPYGKTPQKKLVQRLHRLTSFFRNQNIYTIVIACNAASTVIDQVQKLNPDIQFFGMLEAGQKAIRECNQKSVLVLGGERTVESLYFQSEFKKSKFQIEARLAQPLSAFIEAGKQNSKQFDLSVKSLAQNKKAKAVLLACTHYPAATKVFQKHFPQAKILDPAVTLAQDLKKTIPAPSKKARSLFYTTGSVALSKTSAYKAFQLKISSFKKVNLK